MDLKYANISGFGAPARSVGVLKFALTTASGASAGTAEGRRYVRTIVVGDSARSAEDLKFVSTTRGGAGVWSVEGQRRGG